MSFLEKVLKNIKGFTKGLKKDDFLMEKVDEIFQERWEKISGKKFVSTKMKPVIDPIRFKIALVDDTKMKVTYEILGKKIFIELEHKYPYLVIKAKKGLSGLFDIGFNKGYLRLLIDDYVEIIEEKMIFKKGDCLKKEIFLLIDKIEKKNK